MVKPYEDRDEPVDRIGWSKKIACTSTRWESVDHRALLRTGIFTRGQRTTLDAQIRALHLTISRRIILGTGRAMARVIRVLWDFYRHAIADNRSEMADATTLSLLCLGDPWLTDSEDLREEGVTQPLIFFMERCSSCDSNSYLAQLGQSLVHCLHLLLLYCLLCWVSDEVN